MVVGGDYPFDNILKIHQWLSMTMNDFFLAYSIACDKIKLQSSIGPAQRYREARIDL
jgi:hypothetical protein